MTTQIGVQMYTLRDFCKTPADIASTCKRIADLGFGAVQVSALGPIDVKELRAILDDHGLTCAATHVSLDQMKDTEQCLDYHAALGCELTAVGGFGWEDCDRPAWRNFATEYSAIGRTLAARGLKIGYHNHAHEFVPFAITDNPARISPTDVPYQLLADTLDPSIWFELDTYWVQEGGGSPAGWIEKLAGRVPAIHVKDMTLDTERKHVMCEVGSGNLDWPRILAAAKKAGVRWYLIERDAGLLDPFESLRISRQNMLALGLK